MNGPRCILVVEDDGDIREAIAHALARCGYRVMAARNGRDAIDQLSNETTAPDLIVLDWMMPVMSGFEFLTYQATEPAYRDVPVLVLSAVDRALQTSGVPVAAALSKPVRMRTLIDVIDRLCGLPRRPDSLFASGRYPAIGTTPPPMPEAIPTYAADESRVSSSTTARTIVARPRRDS